MKYLVFVLVVFMFAPVITIARHPHAPIHPLNQIGQPNPLSPPMPVFHCDGTEDPCDESRPWMRGHVEKYCGRTEDQVKQMREANPGATILQCACRHMCDKLNPKAEETQGRAWDGACQARCNPKNCTCPHPCDS